MFPKALLTSFIIGVLSVNALRVPIARSPTQDVKLPDYPLRREPAPDSHSGGEFPGSSSGPS